MQVKQTILSILLITTSLWIIQTSEAVDFSELETIINYDTGKTDYILNIDSLSSDVVTSGTVSGATVVQAGVALDDTYIKLDQVIPQSIINGSPAFNGGTSGVSAPFTVDSTFLVSNLNADLLDGLHASQILTVPGGLDTYVQFNDGGTFGGDSGLIFNKTTNALTCLGTGAFGGTSTGMSIIAAGLTVNNDGGGGVNDDFIAKTDIYITAFQVDASANQINIAVPVVSTVDNKALSFTIGANTLTTSEWAYLDGQDQAVKTTSKPTFAGGIFTSVVRLKGYTVATLPAGTQGDTCYVTDQLTAVAAKGVAPVGGGVVVCVVFYDGVGWVGI